VAGTSEPVRGMECGAQQLRQPGPHRRVTVELNRQPGACWGSHTHPPVASCPEGSMIEFIALNALAVLLLGLGVLIGGHLLAATGPGDRQAIPPGVPSPPRRFRRVTPRREGDS
jgi:hypothetical protein